MKLVVLFIVFDLFCLTWKMSDWETVIQLMLRIRLDRWKPERTDGKSRWRAISVSSSVDTLTLSHTGRGGGGNCQRDTNSTASTVLPAATTTTAATAERDRQRQRERDGVRQKETETKRERERQRLCGDYWRMCETNVITWQCLTSCHYSLICHSDIIFSSLWQQLSRWVRRVCCLRCSHCSCELTVRFVVTQCSKNSARAEACVGCKRRRTTFKSQELRVKEGLDFALRCSIVKFEHECNSALNLKYWCGRH